MSDSRKEYRRAYQHAIRDAAGYVRRYQPELWMEILKEAQERYNLDVKNYEPRTYNERDNNE